jgi:N utilization substance protein B
LEHASDDPDEVIDYHASEDEASPEVVAFARELVQGVTEHRERLDAAIRDASTNWRPEQMTRVDRTLLRIAIYEIAIAKNVPVRAAINESIELAKTFSGEESGRFVNGVLGKVAGTAST